jgi:signal transduction histidine kinase
MAKRLLPKSLTSISAKLLAVIVITGIGINLAIIFSIGAFQHHVAAPFHAHLARYVAYLVDDLGSPPERAQATLIAAQTGMIITFESGSRSWSTAPGFQPFSRDRASTRYDQGGIEVVSYHGNFAVFVSRTEGRIGFYLPRQERAEKKVKLLVLFLLVFISTLLIVAFVAIRWVLRPLGWLKRGVDEVGRGNLGHRVPEKRCDELRDLSEAFNAMTERLSRLITSKDQLLLDVSHELRTPITRIRVALAMLPDSDGKDSIAEDLAEIEAKITELLETARTLGVKAELNRRPVDLAAVVQQVAEMYANQPPGVVLDGIEEVGPLMLDENQILKALRNVVDNAVKYSRPDSAPVRVSLSRHQAEAVIRVRDFGIGIAAEDLPFVFEPFYRADKARSPRGGFGLGLSLVKTIISAHNGRVDIESLPGSGTTVTIHLGDVAD